MEPYQVIPAEYEYQKYVIGEGQFFVLGDNRPNSSDSQNWGAVDASHILGRAVPLDR